MIEDQNLLPLVNKRSTRLAVDRGALVFDADGCCVSAEAAAPRLWRSFQGDGQRGRCVNFSSGDFTDLFALHTKPLPKVREASPFALAIRSTHRTMLLLELLPPLSMCFRQGAALGAGTGFVLKWGDTDSLCPLLTGKPGFFSGDEGVEPCLLGGSLLSVGGSLGNISRPIRGDFDFAPAPLP